MIASVVASDSDAIRNFIHQTFVLIGTQDRDAEKFNDVFDSVRRLAKRDPYYAEQLTNAARSSAAIARDLQSFYEKTPTPPSSVVLTYKSWLDTFKKYVELTELRADMAAKRKFAILRPKQILLFVRYARYGHALKRAYKTLTDLSHSQGITNSEISNWMNEGKLKSGPVSIISDSGLTAG